MVLKVNIVMYVVNYVINVVIAPCVMKQITSVLSVLHILSLSTNGLS